MWGNSAKVLDSLTLTHTEVAREDQTQPLSCSPLFPSNYMHTQTHARTLT